MGEAKPHQSKLDFRVRELKRETRLLAFLMKPSLARLSDVLDRLTLENRTGTFLAHSALS